MARSGSNPPTRRITRRALPVLFVILAGVMMSPPAFAHGGGDEGPEGYLLVQQAIAHLVFSGEEHGIDAALEKIDDLLIAEDQEGVDVSLVLAAQTALGRGDVATATDDLQKSISAALAALSPATGEQTGTTVVAAPIPGREGFTGTDWLFLVASALAVLGGAWLTWRFRPEESVAELRREMGGAK